MWTKYVDISNFPPLALRNRCCSSVNVPWFLELLFSLFFFGSLFLSLLEIRSFLVVRIYWLLKLVGKRLLRDKRI